MSNVSLTLSLILGRGGGAVLGGMGLGSEKGLWPRGGWGRGSGLGVWGFEKGLGFGGVASIDSIWGRGSDPEVWRRLWSWGS